MSRRYVVARFVNAGMGDHVSCVLGAWRYAEATGRTLVIDWRGSRYNLDSSRNCYTDFFAPLNKVGGVPIIADQRVTNFDWVGSYWPEKWSRELLESVEAIGHTHQEIVDVNDLVRSGADRPEPTIVFNQAIDAPYTAELRTISRAIVLSPRLHTPYRAFIDAQFGSRQVFGIHVRHGNGENIGSRANYWIGGVTLIRQLRLNKQFDIHAQDKPDGKFLDGMAPSLIDHRKVTWTERSLYRRIAEDYEAFAKRQGSRGAVAFLCTDARHVVDELTRRIPSLKTYPKRMKAEGSGPLHGIETERRQVSQDITDDLLIEMELLRFSSRLNCMPSQFNLLPRLEMDPNDVVMLKPSFMNRLITRLMR